MRCAECSKSAVTSPSSQIIIQAELGNIARTSWFMHICLSAICTLSTPICICIVNGSSYRTFSVYLYPHLYWQWDFLLKSLMLIQYCVAPSRFLSVIFICFLSLRQPEASPQLCITTAQLNNILQNIRSIFIIFKILKTMTDWKGLKTYIDPERQEDEVKLRKAQRHRL